MKTSKKSAKQAPPQEECGVWLDAVELKEKAKKKQFNRPISKLLNPLAKGSGYSLSVALNFTQTKLQMPKTKQSSLSSFFPQEHRVLNKMASSDAPNTVLPDTSSTSPGCSSSSSLPSIVEVGTKRKRGLDLRVLSSQSREESDRGETFRNMDSERERADRERAGERERPAWQEDYEEDCLPHLAVGREEETEEEPERKRRFTGSPPPQVESDPRGERRHQEEEPRRACRSPEQLTPTGDFIHYDYITQDSESQYKLTHPTAKHDKDLPAFLESLRSEEGFGAWLGEHGRTSTQKSFESTCAFLMDGGKENDRPSPSESPIKNLSLTPLGRLSNHTVAKRSIASPKKHRTEQPWNKAVEKSAPLCLSSHHKWSRWSGAPPKWRVPERPLREAEEDSLAMLFTQDSEGFRVIAHRGLVARSPMKDQTNLVSSMGREERMGTCERFVDEEEEEEEEEEMLFTQDSQGNQVIKH